jgi:hypothetical protein
MRDDVRQMDRRIGSDAVQCSKQAKQAKTAQNSNIDFSINTHHTKCAVLCVHTVHYALCQSFRITKQQLLFCQLQTVQYM